MKRYHAIGIIVASLVVLGSALSLQAEEHKTIVGLPAPLQTDCPFPDTFNTGWVVTDEDGNGITDHQYRIYNSGKCVGQLVDPNDDGLNH